MGFIHPRWWSPFLCWGHQQKDIFKSSWWDDSPLLRHGHHGLSDGVRSFVWGEVVPCKQTLSSQCLDLSWKVVVLHTLFLADIPKKGKGIHFDVWFFQAANKYMEIIIMIIITKKYSYIQRIHIPLSEPVTPCKLSRICGCCLSPEGGFAWWWIFKHCVAILACVRSCGWPWH